MPIALDFGTCNTVIARWNDSLKGVEFIRFDGLSRRYAYRIPGDGGERAAHVLPSLIHYGAGEDYLIGEKVSAAGLTSERGTFRWVKLDMLKNNSKSRRINGRMISYREAATDLLRRVLLFTAGSRPGAAEEDLVVTVPVESFDHYTEWLREVAGAIFKRDIRVLDEATACILGHEERVKNGELYAIVDFGGGTLDVSIVKTNLAAEADVRCRVLGRAGEELGGALVDKWLLEEIQQREGLSDQDVADIGAVLLQRIEEAKIGLSSGAERVDIVQYNDITGRQVCHTMTRQDLSRVLAARELPQIISRTLFRALEAAADKYGTKKSEIREVLMVGGSSLLLGVADTVRTLFPDCRVRCDSPFEAIAAGACRFMGEDLIPTLVHDYCLKAWNRAQKDYDLVPVVPRGTQYPTERPVTAKYLNSACHGADCLGIVIHERSYMSQPDTAVTVDASGAVRISRGGGATRETTRPLNPEDRQFIFAVPPCELDDTKRFIAGFGVDLNKRLTISVKDTREGNQSYIKTRDGEEFPLPVKDFAIVRL
jgi:molecular chaperone DnaK (HSP70)